MQQRSLGTLVTGFHTQVLDTHAIVFKQFNAL